MTAAPPLAEYDFRRLFERQADALAACVEGERATGGGLAFRAVNSTKGHYVTVRDRRTHELRGYLGYGEGDE